MKKFLLVAILLLLRLLLYAQDTLYRLDGTIQLIRVIEVNSEQLRYRQFSDPDGPVFVLSKQAVAKIIYENGTEEIFQTVQVIAAAPTEVSHEQIFKRNILSLNIADFIVSSLTFGYEFLSPSGKWGYKLPVSFGLRSIGKDYRFEDEWPGIRVFHIKPGLNFYPYGQDRITFYAGLYYLYQINKYREYDYYSEESKRFFSGPVLHTGTYLPLTHNIEISGQLGIGWIKMDPFLWHDYPVSELRLYFEINISLRL
jgi:hypothetical protein